VLRAVTAARQLSARPLPIIRARCRSFGQRAGLAPPSRHVRWAIQPGHTGCLTLRGVRASRASKAFRSRFSPGRRVRVRERESRPRPTAVVGARESRSYADRAHERAGPSGDARPFRRPVFRHVRIDGDSRRPERLPRAPPPARVARDRRRLARRPRAPSSLACRR